MKKQLKKEWTIKYKKSIYDVGSYVLAPPILYIYMFELEKFNLDGKGLGRKYYKILERKAKKKRVIEVFGEIDKKKYPKAEGFWTHMDFTIIPKGSKESEVIQEKLKLSDSFELSQDFDDEYSGKDKDIVFMYKKL